MRALKDTWTSGWSKLPCTRMIKVKNGLKLSILESTNVRKNSLSNQTWRKCIGPGTRIHHTCTVSRTQMSISKEQWTTPTHTKTIHIGYMKYSNATRARGNLELETITSALMMWTNGYKTRLCSLKYSIQTSILKLSRSQSEKMNNIWLQWNWSLTSLQMEVLDLGWTSSRWLITGCPSFHQRIFSSMM